MEHKHIHLSFTTGKLELRLKLLQVSHNLKHELKEVVFCTNKDLQLWGY